MAGICLVVSSAVCFPGTPLSRFLNSRPMVWLGVLSYSLYIWNNLFLYDGSWLVNRFPLNYLSVLIMALLSSYLVERPFLSLKERFPPRASG